MNIPINFDNLGLFIRLMTKCKMNESSKGIRHLLKGFSSVIPLGRLRLLYDFKDVEHMVCGEREINIEVLKAHTWSNDLNIKDKLFTVLEEFTNEQLQSFLRFVSGRSRLPTTKNDWYMIIDVENPNKNISQIDQRLPTAVTCGFRLLLPQYSSLDILKERLLYAIKKIVQPLIWMHMWFTIKCSSCTGSKQGGKKKYILIKRRCCTYIKMNFF